jgi:hypothetical protein
METTERAKLYNALEMRRLSEKDPKTRETFRDQNIQSLIIVLLQRGFAFDENVTDAAVFQFVNALKKKN